MFLKDLEEIMPHREQRELPAFLTHAKLLYCSLSCPTGKSAAAQGITKLGQAGEAG